MSNCKSLRTGKHCDSSCEPAPTASQEPEFPSRSVENRVRVLRGESMNTILAEPAECKCVPIVGGMAISYAPNCPVHGHLSQLPLEPAANLGQKELADALADFEREMSEKVIPEVVVVMQKREQAWQERYGHLSNCHGTEREMHNAWRKRAEQAEAELSSAHEKGHREGMEEAAKIADVMKAEYAHEINLYDTQEKIAW